MLQTFMFFFYTPQYLTVVLVATFTMERYVAVCHPFLKEKWCTVRRAAILVLILVVVCMLVSTGNIFMWTYLPPPYHMCTWRPAAYRGHPESFVHIWRWSVEMLVFAVLPLIVLIFNVMVIREIVRLANNGVVIQGRRSSSITGGSGGGGSGGNTGSNTTASTLTLLSVSFFLIITQLVSTLISNIDSLFPTGPFLMTDEQITQDNTWSAFFTYMNTKKILDIVCMSHYSCYFFVYCLTGKHFRREVIYLLSGQGKIKCCQQLLDARQRREQRYSMVSSNGHSLATTEMSMSHTVSTAFTSM